jgi:hypothetical protein
MTGWLRYSGQHMIDDLGTAAWVILGHVAGAHAGYAGSIDMSAILNSRSWMRW